MNLVPLALLPPKIVITSIESGHFSDLYFTYFSDFEWLNVNQTEDCQGKKSKLFNYANT